MSNKLHLKITTHEKTVFDSDVDEIYSKGSNGEFGVLPNHIPFMTPLEIGVTKVIKDGKPYYEDILEWKSKKMKLK